MTTIREKIDQIGAALVGDTFTYPDIVCKSEKGIIPRCLILEEKDREESARGAVVVGINPGRASDKECAYYLENGCSYDAVKDYWWHNLGYNHRYYKQLREFLNESGIRGPILWTELVHCESAAGVKQLSVQTVRDSIDRYLEREIACVSETENSPLIGVGAKAFEILAYRFPRRLVIGIPHPTGSFGQFAKLMPKRKLEPHSKEQLTAFLKNGKPVAALFQCAGNNCRFR